MPSSHAAASADSLWVKEEDLTSMGSGTTAISSFWQVYNSEDTFLPLYLPLVIWLGTYLYCRVVGKDFHHWYALHNFHNITAMTMGLISIYYNDNTIFQERVGILFSLGYFAVDCLDCTLRQDWTYLFHGVACFVMGLFNYTNPFSFRLRMNSKATFCELSNPLMHLAKTTRNPLHFAAFAAMFTLCRVIWIPFLMYQLHQGGMPLTTSPIFVMLLLFYGLNLFWYYKIIGILIKGLMGKTVKEE